MVGKANLEFQCLEKANFRIPMFGTRHLKCRLQSLEKGKIKNSNVWKKTRFRIPIFGKRQNLEFQCLEKGKI